MRTNNASINESALCEGYRQQLSHYTDALQKADELIAAIRQDRDPANSSADLALLMENIRHIESSNRECRNLWLQQGHISGAELRETVANLDRAIRRLIDRVDLAQREILEQKAALSPEMEFLSRGRQMQAGYGRATSR